jgi:hypothetical protein
MIPDLYEKNHSVYKVKQQFIGVLGFATYNIYLKPHAVGDILITPEYYNETR